MSELNIFEKASRLKLRFATARGELTVEQLWDLPLTSKNNPNLDDIAIELHTRLQARQTKSFVDSPASTDIGLELGFDIVKHIIDVRKTENASKTEEAAKESQRRLLRDAIAEQQNKELLTGDVATLQKRLAELG